MSITKYHTNSQGGNVMGILVNGIAVVMLAWDIYGILNRKIREEHLSGYKPLAHAAGSVFLGGVVATFYSGRAPISDHFVALAAFGISTVCMIALAVYQNRRR